MILTLHIAEQREAGPEPAMATLRLDRHGAIIGRSAHADWPLPDPRNYISSRHCEISFRDGTYLLTDRSTNGTFINGASDRLAAPHPIAAGDEILIGHFLVRVTLDAGEAMAKVAPPPTAAPAATADAALDWPSWSTPATEPDEWAPVMPAAQAAAIGVWGDIPVARAPEELAWGTPAAPAISGAGALSGHWAPPQPRAAEPVRPAPVAPVPPADDIWARLAEGHQVDWGLEAPPAKTPEPEAAQSASPLPDSADDVWAAFLRGAQLAPGEVGIPAEAAAELAGTALRLLLAGLLPLVEARSRAKAQMGAVNTILEFDGNNPLKFVRSPTRALALLLNPPQPGFMTTARAVDSAYRDLQAHQMATLMAMQGALRATLDDFSPVAIRSRMRAHRGGRAAFLPILEDARAWRAYEEEFDGVTAGSSEAFIDMFAKEFRAAYERISQAGDGAGT
ncbi:type VI secretion system FHA domain protein [Sphingomonas zeicaulis]|uniref:type VI secretion system-associated FHA domain protein TagH n=1 Tax=Sphingomonas zeicaulis TaxID=1632740 RepID=UPI003D20FC59